jgi:hypothetical protein
MSVTLSGITIVFNDLQYLNARVPMLFTLLGIVIDFNDSQL